VEPDGRVASGSDTLRLGAPSRLNMRLDRCGRTSSRPRLNKRPLSSPRSRDRSVRSVQERAGTEAKAPICRVRQAVHKRPLFAHFHRSLDQPEGPLRVETRHSAHPCRRFIGRPSLGHQARGLSARSPSPNFCSGERYGGHYLAEGRVPLSRTRSKNRRGRTGSGTIWRRLKSQRSAGTGQRAIIRPWPRPNAIKTRPSQAGRRHIWPRAASHCPGRDQKTAEAERAGASLA
jgi:hypothetical protein